MKHPAAAKLASSRTAAILDYGDDVRCCVSTNHHHDFGREHQRSELRVEGENRPGVGFALMSALAVAGINLRGLSVSAVGGRYVSYLAFDDADTATLAVQVLANLPG